jgi:hypothetical protein
LGILGLGLGVQGSIKSTFTGLGIRGLTSTRFRVKPIWAFMVQDEGLKGLTLFGLLGFNSVFGI